MNRRTPSLVSIALTVVFSAATCPQAWAQKGEGAGNPEKDVKRYSEAVKKAPDDKESWFNLAFANYKAKKYDDAATSAAKAAELNPSGVAVRQLAGAIARKRGKSAEALAWYEKAQSLETEGGGTATFDTVMGLADTYADLGRYDDAIAAYKLARKASIAEKKGDKSAINNQLGVAYMKAGNIEEAKKAFESNVKDATDSQAAHYNLGQMYRKLAMDSNNVDFWKAAAEPCKKAADMAPGDAIAQYFAGEALLFAGRDAESVAYFDRYLAGDPGGKKAVAKFGAAGKTEIFDGAPELKAEALKKD